jgi:hypothetical protein
MARSKEYIACEVSSLEVIAEHAGVTLTGDDCDKWQDYLEESCTCKTFKALRLEYYGNTLGELMADA